MSYSHAVAIEPDLEELSQYHGLRCRGLIRPRSVSVISQLLVEIKAQNLVNGQLSFDLCPIKKIEKGNIHLAEGRTLHAPVAALRLKKASYLFIGVVTLGDKIADTITGLFKSGRRLEAILLEEVANFFLMKAAVELERRGERAAELRELTISGPLSPGDDGFELSTQGLILKLVNARAIGISITPTHMMTPQHTLSVVYGLGLSMPKWSQLENCENCRSREKCPHLLTLEA